MSITADNAIFDARVKKGAEQLDSVYGTGWRDKIDTATLNLSSSTKCTLGQVYGDYHEGLRKLGLSSYNTDAQDYGFTTLDSGDPSNSKIAAAWLRLLSYKDGEVVEGNGWNAVWSFLRVEKTLRVNDKTYLVVQPGTMKDGEFQTDEYENARLYTASNLGKNYKRYAPLPKKGSVVKTKDGEIYYIGKDNMAWRIDAEVSRWVGVQRLVDQGGLTVLKTALGKDFNALEK